MATKRKISIGLLAVVLMAVSGGCRYFHKDQQTGEVPVEEWIEATGKQFAPDSREHVWEIRAVKKDGKWLLEGATDKPDALNALLKKLKENKVSYKNSVKLLPEERFRSTAGVARLSVINLRKTPAHTSELVTQLLMGMPVEILEEQNGFYRVRTPSGYLGWVDADGIILMDKENFGRWAATPKVLVDVPYVRLLEAPDPNSKQVSDAVLNDVMALTRKDDFFDEVLLPDGRKAYVRADAVTDLEEWHYINTELFNYADLLSHLRRNYPGIPYLWGGTSIKGMDCSGFVKNVFQNFGLLMPRDASQQFKTGKPLTINDTLGGLTPGDLLFFGQKAADGSLKITHVAIYTGKGRIMHAAGEIKEESLLAGDSLYNDYRRKSLVGARRIFGNYNRWIYPYYTAEAVKIYFHSGR